MEEKYLKIITNSWVSSKLLKELKKNIKSNYNEPKDLKNICIHIKNGINNFYLKTKIDKSNSITSLIIEDKEYKCNKNHKFKITLSISLLEKFFLEFSTSIIKWFN
ncbi:MAG: hypothetical protein J6C29_00570 [Clostridia bacterium]|nr:hypothetical protein [Clostridia bacterium]